MTVDVSASDSPLDIRKAANMNEWNATVSKATEVEGYSLIGGKENERTMDLLIGVPLIIKNVSFRQGDMTPKGQTEPRDYVSVECMIHPDHAHKFPRKYVVFNDGSTGVYREIVKRLEREGRVTLPDGPRDGEANTTVYDAPLSSDGVATEFADINLYAPEGLRKSDYKNDDGSSAATFYLG